MPKKSKAFLITILVLTFALTIGLADLFSSIITVGNFAFLPSQSVKSPSYKIYAISLHKAPTHSQASIHVQDVKLRSGAGYIYASSGIYYVLASGYENENDAVNVQNNLKEQNVQSEILIIDIGEISFDSTFSGSEKSALVEGVSSFKNAFQTLYDISISLDTGVKDAIQAKQEVLTLLNKTTKVKQDFENVFKAKLTSEIFQTKLKLTELSTAIESIIELDHKDKILLSSQIKENYFKIVALNKNLSDELSKI